MYSRSWYLYVLEILCVFFVYIEGKMEIGDVSGSEKLSNYWGSDEYLFWEVKDDMVDNLFINEEGLLVEIERKGSLVGL